MAARDWTKTLRLASYRGVKFWVEKDQIETGRRLVIHEFPNKDKPYVEDMGRKTKLVHITGYLLSDNADREADALIAACERGGAAALVLPTNRLRAHCDTCARDFQKDKLGYVAFGMDFVLDGSGAGPFQSPGYLGRLIEVKAGEIRAAARGAFLSRYYTLGAAGYVVASAADTIRDFAVAFEAVRAATRQDAEKAPALRALVQDIYDEADALADVGATGDIYVLDRYVQTAETQLETPVVDRVFDAFEALGKAAEGEDAAAAVENFLTYGEDFDAISLTTKNRERENANRDALISLVRQAASAAYVLAVTQSDFPDRRAAVQARADISELLSLELARLTGHESHDVFWRIDELRGLAADYFDQLIADLAPINKIAAGASMPSLFWANYLYGDAMRAPELADRNRVKHPMFMPRDFEALAF